MNSLESVWRGGHLTQPEQRSLKVCTRLVLYDSVPIQALSQASGIYRLLEHHSCHIIGHIRIILISLPKVQSARGPLTTISTSVNPVPSPAII